MLDFIRSKVGIISTVEINVDEIAKVDDFKLEEVVIAIFEENWRNEKAIHKINYRVNYEANKPIVELKRKVEHFNIKALIKINFRLRENFDVVTNENLEILLT